jgi:hypothetical protein
MYKVHTVITKLLIKEFLVTMFLNKMSNVYIILLANARGSFKKLSVFSKNLIIFTKIEVI